MTKNDGRPSNKPGASLDGDPNTHTTFDNDYIIEERLRSGILNLQPSRLQGLFGIEPKKGVYR